jgi:hypothetical protein
MELAPAVPDELAAAWQASARAAQDLANGPDVGPEPALTEQFLVLVTCRDEKEQLELLGRLKEEGRECKALLA